MRTSEVVKSNASLSDAGMRSSSNAVILARSSSVVSDARRAMPLFDRNMRNILLIALGSTFYLTALFTNGFIEELVVSGLAKRGLGGFGENDGYISFSLMSAGGLCMVLLTPSLIALLGGRVAFVGSTMIGSLFMPTFLYPLAWLVLGLSAPVGAANCLYGVAQAQLIADNSPSPRLMQRNTAVYWAISETSLIWGNLLVYYRFRHEKVIDDASRLTVYTALSLSCAAGVVCYLFVRKPLLEKKSGGGERDTRPWRRRLADGIVSPFQLLRQRRTQMLVIPMLYTGLEMTFMMSIFSTAVGFSKQLGDDAKSLVGLCGIVIGISEIITAGLISWSAHRIRILRRFHYVALTAAAELCAYALLLVALPWPSPLGETDADALIGRPRISLVLCIAFLLGIGDGAFQTQMYALLGDMYQLNDVEQTGDSGNNDFAASFALFSLAMSVVSIASFYYATKLQLWGHLLILTLTLVGAVFCFWKVDREHRAMRRSEKE